MALFKKKAAVDKTSMTDKVEGIEPKTKTVSEQKLKKIIYHITKRSDGKWHIRGAGQQESIALFDAQSEAIEFGDQLLKTTHCGVIIHDLDGKIRKSH